MIEKVSVSYCRQGDMDAETDLITVAIEMLKMLTAPQASQLSANHNTNTATQGFALLPGIQSSSHAPSGQFIWDRGVKTDAKMLA